ncbi:MAG TPA: FAD:protein FMN transferase [Deltaproteobacteria bacterium]|nr:FAD:protein FMN transferase [Deltaproteobacteria bacterium]HQI01381.1 FAD:protein FMN transferase [Deltaproteobacteria bacterium]
MKKILTAFILLLLLAALTASIRYGRTHEIHTTSIFLTDVFIELKAMGTQSETGEAMKKAVAELKRIDARLGHKDSLIDELNRKHVIRDREVFHLLRVSREVHDDSSGAFSVTLRPLLDAWGFTGNGAYHMPSPSEFEAWRETGKDESVRLHGDGMTIETLQGTKVDIGGTIEGYAADRAREVMKACGIRTGLIDVGGEVSAFGDRVWRIGLKNPRGEGVFAVIPIKNRAVATSGDYERFFMENGLRYCHILDPSTGMPAQIGMSSTVIADTCTQANAWAVALFVSGPEKLGPVLEKKGMDWIFVDSRGRIHASRAMRAHCPDRIPVSAP